MQPTEYSGFLKVVYEWQTLVGAVLAGALALLAAFLAAWPVWRQLKALKVQSAVLSRDVLTTRLRALEARRNATREKIGSVTGAFMEIRQPYEEEGDAPDITPHWAFKTEHMADELKGFLAAHQDSSLDGVHIDAARKAVMLAVEELARCLYQIHAPYSLDLHAADLNLTDSQIENAEEGVEKDADNAKVELEAKRSTVSKSAGELDTAFASALLQLRSRISLIDDLVVREKPPRS